MRLINTKTGQLIDFMRDYLPSYAILSHTWENDEVSLQEYRHIVDPSNAQDPAVWAAQTKAGYLKIRNCIELAASRQILYVWVDTCCIDKTSSAELSEAINSMFQWYQKAEVCYVYLADINSTHGGDIRASRWFTRGWTLQELIAPLDVEFYNRSWKFLGTKDSNLTSDISNITRIPSEVLLSADPFRASVAQRMSWASKRVTTRIEDLAYCLLGVFQVHMTLLYGEGENAFQRLQEQIASSSTDHTLFAWGRKHDDYHSHGFQDHEQSVWSFRNIFARSPLEFSRCFNIVEEEFLPSRSWTKTNRGLNVILPTIPALAAKDLLFIPANFPLDVGKDDYLAILNCSDVLDTLLGIWLTRIDHRLDQNDRYVRGLNSTVRLHVKHVQRVLENSPDHCQKSLWLSTSSSPKVSSTYFSPRICGFRLERMGSRIESTMTTHHVYKGLDHTDRTILCPSPPLQAQGGLVGVITLTINARRLAVVFGYPLDGDRPLAVITDRFNNESPLNIDLQHYQRHFGGQHQSYQIHSDDEGRHRDVTLVLRSIIVDENLFTSLQIIPPELTPRDFKP